MTDRYPDFELATEETYLRAADRESGPQRGILTFLVSGETYGIDIAHIREIIKVGELTEVPRAPTFVIGVITVRGQVIPVLDLRLRLRLDAAALERSARILVVLHQSERYGLLVDAVHGVVRFNESAIEPPPTTLASGESNFISGIGRHAGTGRRERMVVLLDLGAVVSFEVRKRVFLQERAP